MYTQQKDEAQYYHIELRPKEQYAIFSTKDFGAHGHVLQVLGKRFSDGWETVSVLINKNDAHVASNGYLVIDDKRASAVLSTIYGPIRRVKDNFFKAMPRYPAGEKPVWSARHIIKPS